MIRMTTFYYSPGVFSGITNQVDKIESLLNKIGRENIINFTSAGTPSGTCCYTIIYEDNSET